MFKDLCAGSRALEELRQRDAVITHLANPNCNKVTCLFVGEVVRVQKYDCQKTGVQGLSEKKGLFDEEVGVLQKKLKVYRQGVRLRW